MIKINKNNPYDYCDSVSNFSPVYFQYHYNLYSKMSRPVTELQNPEILSDYIAALQKQLNARKKENQQMHRYFESTLPFIQQVNQALEREKQENRKCQAIIINLNFRIDQILEQKEELARLLVNEEDKVNAILHQNIIYKGNLHEKNKKIEELIIVNEQLLLGMQRNKTQINSNDEKPAQQKQEQEIKFKIMKIKVSQLQNKHQSHINKLESNNQKLNQIIHDQQNKIKEIRQEMDFKNQQIFQLNRQIQNFLMKIEKYQNEIYNLKNNYQPKEDFFIKNAQIQKNYYIQKLNSAHLYIQLQQKNQFISSITQQAYKQSLSAFDQTIKQQKITIDNLTELLQLKDKELQALQNSNSTLRKLKISMINNQESIDSLTRLGERLTQGKEETLSLSVMNQLESQQGDKFRIGKTFQSMNLNLGTSRKLRKRLITVQTNIPMSAQDRKKNQYN